MARHELRGRRLLEFGNQALSPIAAVSWTAVGAAVIAAGLSGAAYLYFAGLMYFTKIGWNLLVFDPGDIFVYFYSAHWVIDGGRLYREAPSDYPLFANIIFATLRYLGNLLHPGIYGFCILWTASAWFVYLWA